MHGRRRLDANGVFGLVARAVVHITFKDAKSTFHKPIIWDKRCRWMVLGDTLGGLSAMTHNTGTRQRAAKYMSEWDSPQCRSRLLRLQQALVI